MSEDPTIVNPPFDTSTRADAIDIGPVGPDAPVESVHPFPGSAGGVVPGSATVGVTPELPVDIVDPAPLIVPPDIVRVSDDPIPPPPENLADPMM